ncbi:YdcF family protein, partial [Oenococcus oeni]
IMSGGQGYDEKISEAKAMRTWIIKHNYSPSKVILEDRSTNTKENFQKSAEKILEDQKTNNLGKQIRMVFVTNSYHLTRANYIAFSNNLKIFGIPAKTTRNYLALGWFREFAAMLLIKKHQHLFVLVLLLVISLGLALFSWIN